MSNALTGRLATPADAHRFVFAGHAILTLKSAKTGARFTYKIEVSQDGKRHFVKVLTGPENTNDYQYLGYIWQSVYTHGVKSTICISAPSAQAFTFFAKQLHGLTFHPALEVWHEGRCGRCNRTLTVPASIKSGIGPECAKIMGVILADDPAPEAPKSVRENGETADAVIRVRYTSIDRWTSVKAYKTLSGARKFAQLWVGQHPEIGTTYAVSGDGIGKISVEGCTLADLFPAAS